VCVCKCGCVCARCKSKERMEVGEGVCKVEGAPCRERAGVKCVERLRCVLVAMGASEREADLWQSRQSFRVRLMSQAMSGPGPTRPGQAKASQTRGK
jgi:hypothetical protein